jgi:RNA polymerase sigma factor (sigma-70 family)
MENIDLIRKIAWSFHKSSGIDCEDLMQEAYIGYMKAMKTYDPNKSKITTHAWLTISSHLKNYLKLNQKQTEHLCSIEEHPVNPCEIPNPYFECLTTEAQKIADIILETPRYFLECPQREAFRRIKKILKNHGWPVSKINEEIQNLTLIYTNS